MKLPIPFLKSKKPESKYYLALLLEDEKIASVILEEDEGKVKIVGKHEEHLTTHLETIPVDELIPLVDKAISRAEEVLPPDIETHKTVFGVKDSWVENETKKIKKEHLTKLKKVCDALDLTPIGFMVISEAIANLLQSEEGAPLSAILLELSKKTAHLTLFRGGQVSETAKGPIEHSAPQTVDTLLKKFTAPVLPAKIILTHTKETNHLASHFSNHEWSKSLPFLHVPQISVLPEDFDAKAVAFGAAHQMGFEILGLETNLKGAKELGVGKIDEEAEKDSPTAPADEPTVSDNFGFIADQDIAKMPTEIPTQVDEDSNDPQTVNEPEETTKDEESHVSLQESEHEDRVNPDAMDEPKKVHKKNNLFMSVATIIPSMSMPKFSKLSEFFGKNKGLKLPIIILVAVILLGVGLSLFYFYNVKAEVLLSVKPNNVTQESDVTLSTSGSSDFSKNIIAARSVTSEIDGDLSTDATGKKDIGEKAKGTLTVYNSDDSRTQLSSGAEIKSANGLSFTLDKDISIASASGDIFSGTKPGTAEVSVTAKEIGTESNLPSGTKFTLGGNSSLAGKNDSAFSGGSKKSVTVVSKKDLDKLRADLPKKLENDAKEDISKKAGDGETVLPVVLSFSLKEEKFDKKTDEEAKQVKLTATVAFDGLVYENSQIDDFSKSVLKDKYSEDIAFAKDSIKIKVENAKKRNDKEIGATLAVSAGLLPEIDKEEVINKLQNRSPKEAKAILETLPQVVEADIKYSPNIFFLPSILQKLPKDLKVTVKTD